MVLLESGGFLEQQQLGKVTKCWGTFAKVANAPLIPLLKIFKHLLALISAQKYVGASWNGFPWLRSCIQASHHIVQWSIVDSGAVHGSLFCEVLNSLFSVFQSDGWVWVWQMPGELTCKLKNISVKLVCNVRLCFKRWFYLLSVTLVMFLCPESMSHLSSLLWKIHPQTVMNMT